MKTTIDDFSYQWTTFDQHPPEWSADHVLADYLGPLGSLEDFRDKRVCEIGSGIGRFVHIISKYAREVVAVEPCDGIEVSKRYNKDCPNIRHIKKSIYELEGEGNFDIAISLGVVHHTPNPLETLQKIHTLLQPQGKAIIWVYGREGNGLYLALTKPLRVITTRMSNKSLVTLSNLLYYPLAWYIQLCRFLPLPLRQYLIKQKDFSKQTIVTNIFDQLNPTIAFYWTKEEFEALLRAAGFSEIKLYHRDGYSWTAVANY